MVGAPLIYKLLVELHKQRKEFILADEWVRISQKKYPDCVMLKQVEIELEDAIESEMKTMVKDLKHLYCNNNWNSDPGIPIAVHDVLFKNPIQRRKSLVLGEGLGILAASLAKRLKPMEGDVKRLSDTFFIQLGSSL